MLKVKRDTLQKRLGLQGLNVPAAQQVGLNLGTHKDRVVTFDSIPWPATSQRYWSIGSYSDNAGSVTRQSLVPDVVSFSKRTCITPDTTAFDTDVTVIGDYTIQVWTACVAGTIQDASSNLQLFYQVVENRTENVLVPPQIVEPSAANLPVIRPRVFVTGNYVVLTYQIGTAVYARAMSNVTAGFGARVNFATSSVYDADSALGDSNNFVAAALNQPRAMSPVLTIYKISVPAFAVVQSGTVTDATLTNASSRIWSVGVWASNFSNGFGVAYGYTDASGNTTIGGAMDSYSSIPATTNGATLNAVVGGNPNPPNTIAIVNLGVIPFGGGGSTNSFGIWWGTPGSLLNGAGISGVTGFSAYSWTTYLSFYKSGGGVPTTTGGGFMPRVTYGVVPVSRPYVANAVPYIMVCTQSSIQGTYYLCAADYAYNVTDPNPFPLRPVSTIAPRQALTPSAADLSTNCAPGNTFTLTHIYPASTLPYGAAVTSLMTTPVGQKLCPTLFNTEFSSKHLYESAMYGQSLAFASGMPSLYDGNRSVEAGYCWYPEVANVPNTTTPTFSLYQDGSGTGPQFAAIVVNNDVVNYIFTYEWTDAQGQSHIGARSAPYQVTSTLVYGTNVAAGLGAGSPPASTSPVQIQFNIPTIGIGYRALPQGASLGSQESILGPIKSVQIGVYRTAVNGTIYYKVSDPQGIGDSSGTGTSAVVGRGSTFYNSTSASYVTFVDSTLENSNPGSVFLTQNPLLYGDGTDSVSGSVDNLNGPSTDTLCSHKGRIFISDGNNVWFTKQLSAVPGTPSFGMAPAFNETSLLFTVGDGQSITGLASMDGNLIIFKRRSIYYVAGDGPLDNGNQNDFTSPQPVPTNLGCTDSRSIEVTPEGCYFYSDAGYRILDRSLTVQYPGTSIEDELAEFPIITSAVVHPNNNRMILCAAQNDDVVPGEYVGEWISRDYVLDAWTTGALPTAASKPAMIAAGVGMAPANLPDSVNREKPTLFMLGADGTLWREKDPLAGGKVYYDSYNGTDYYFKEIFQTSNWTPDNVAGFARCFSAIAMVDIYDYCLFTLEALTDYGLVSNQGQWNVSALSSSNVIGVAQPSYPEVYLKNQRIKAASFFMEDGPPTDGNVAATGQGFAIKGITMNVGVYPGAARSVPGDRQ